MSSDSWEPVVPFDRAAQAAREELSVVIGRVNAAQADLLALTDRVIDQQLWAVAGIRSIEHWLACFAGVSPSRAGDLVSVSTRTPELPRMRASVDTGALTLDQAAVVARHTPATHDGEVAEFAPNASVTQLRRALCKYSFPEPAPEPEPASASESAADPGSSPGPEPDPKSESGVDEADGEQGAGSRAGGSAFGPAGSDSWDPAVRPARVRMGYREGRFHLEYSAPAQVGALVEQALIEAKDALFQAGHPAATLGAAVEEVVTRSLLQAGQVTPSRESRYRVYLHLGTEGTGWLHQRGALPDVVVDRLTCDGVLQPVWETGGSPVNVGRAQHIVPERTRRLVQDRDRGCRYPGCVSIYHLEVHHLQHWRDGGLTDIDNLACLCGHHHDAYHRGQFRITGNPEHPNGPSGLEFTTETGGPIGPVTTDRSSDTGTSTGGSDTGTPPSPTTPSPTTPSPTRPRRYIGPTGQALHPYWVDFGPGTPPAPPTGGPGHAPTARDLASDAVRTHRDTAPAAPEPPPPDAIPPDAPPAEAMPGDASPRAPIGPDRPPGVSPDAWMYAQADGCTYWATPDAYQRAGEDPELTGPAATAYLLRMMAE
ncbi:HNH endonuclease signature motif containing protein [Leekyejoonella antrihumi]|uniref:HNH endonuclease signature motif containing protein n=1 Tax=Leekyejoonella antrihumi TaxID=1660198 RepID=UPI001644AED2|nr:HNH endonuclease signature motif containing protein [Leekyejoonella antrihumi]